MAADWQPLYQQLASLLTPYQNELNLVRNDQVETYLNTHHIMNNGKPLFFAAVKTTKRYVSFHLMPVYVFPELLTNLSSSLAKRMHGKSCFNFTAIDDEVLAQLDALVTRGYRAYCDAGYISQKGTNHD